MTNKATLGGLGHRDSRGPVGQTYEPVTGDGLRALKQSVFRLRHRCLDTDELTIRGSLYKAPYDPAGQEIRV